MQFAPYAIPLVITAAISAGLALYSRRRHLAAGEGWFALLMLAVSVWSLSYALELSSDSLAGKLFWSKVEYLGITTVPPLWLAFALQYTGREKWLTRRNRLLLSIEPVVTLLLVWTNEFHRQIWQSTELRTSGSFPMLNIIEYGAFFWLHAAYSYVLLALGTWLLARAFIGSSRLYRRQVAILLVGLLAPWVGNALYISRLGPFPGLDLTPFGYTLTGLAVIWGLFRFRLLDIVPVARDAVIAEMPDGVIVLDAENRIIDLNPAAQRIIGHQEDVIGQSVVLVLSGRPDVVEHFRATSEARGDVVLGGGQALGVYDLRTSPLHDRHGRPTGQIVMLHDITERKEAEEAQRRLANRQATLYEVLRTVGAYLDPETVARAAVIVVARMTNWPVVTVLLPEDSEGGQAARLAPQAEAGVLASTEKWEITAEQGIVGRAFRTGETQYVPDVSIDPDYVGDIPAVRSMMAVPLRRSERVLGVLDIESDVQAAFDGNDVLLAESLAEAIALAMDNAQLHTEMRQHADDLGMLYEITRIVSQSLVLEDVLAETLSSAITYLDLDAGVVSLTDLVDGGLHLAAELGLPPVFRERLQQEGLAGTLCAYVHNSGRGVLAIGDIEQETPSLAWARKEAPAAIDSLRAMGMRAYVGIPLSYQEQSFGILSLFARQPRTFSTRMLAQQVAIGQQIAAAVSNTRLFRSIADERSQLQALIASSRDGIILIGIDQRVLVMNATAINFLHLGGQPEDWIDRPLKDALSVLRRYVPSVVKATIFEMRRVRKGDEPFGEGEYEVPPRQIHWLNLPVTSGKKPLGRLLVLRDVTEERLLERMRDDLTRTLVHDLRNPLTSISVSLDLLNKVFGDAASSTQRQMMDIARQNTDKMLELVNAILDIGRMESGRMPLQKSAVSLGELVAGVVESQLPLVAEKGLRLENEVPSDLPPAYADAALIERVLRNLIGNAIKFTSTGDIVHVAARADMSGEPSLLVSISDTGPGIPADIRELLFQKFVTGRQEERGSGLGLVFCKMAIEAHGERIWVESPPEGGAMFTFTLPLFQE
ncbi:MAG: GAF domain-containing protein [Anaerolineae bacterium]|nr:GAF domain-containing protein [Anaerolineae bacterium]